MSETGELVLVGIAVCGAFAAVGVLTVLIGLNLYEEWKAQRRNISVTSTFYPGSSKGREEDDTENNAP